MSRRFLALSLLISIPSLGMQPLQQRVQQKLRAQIIKCEIVRAFLAKKGIIRSTPLIGMQAVAVDLAQDPAVTTNALTSAAVLGGLGAVSFSLAASPLVGAAAGGAIFFWCWNSGSSSTSTSHGNFTAPDTTSYSDSYNDVVIDPVTQFKIFPNDPRYTELKAKQQSPAPFILPVPTPPVNNNGPKKDKHGGHPHPEWKHHPQDFKEDSRTTENYKEHKDGSLRLKGNAKNPYRTSDGKAVEILKVDDKTHAVDAYSNRKHVGSLDPVSGTVAKGTAKGRPYYSKGYGYSDATKASQKAYNEYHDPETHTITQWQVSEALEGPTEFYGQEAADMHYSANTTALWSGSWDIGE